MKISKWLARIALSLVLVILPAMSVSAKEKEMSVDITQRYKQVTFNFTFEEDKMYEVVITGEDGSITEKTIQGKSGSIDIYDVPVTTYHVKIIAEGDIKASAKLTCISEKVTQASNTITVTSALTELQMYFSDGMLVVEWKDTGVGKVNISVTNPENMQKIANDTVTGTRYELKLASKINNIEVYVVPTSSAKIDGAGVKYAMEVVRDVEGNVIYGETNVTNSNNYSFNVEVIDGYSVEVEVNGKLAYHNTFAEGGVYEVEIPITNTSNSIKTYIIDKKGNRKSSSVVISKDMVAPTLTFSNEYNDMKTKDSRIVISGNMVDGNRLYVDQYEVKTDEYGRFNFACDLEVGENIVNVSAVDEAGNENLVTFVITRKSGISFVLFTITSILLIASAVVLVYVFKKPKEEVKVMKEKVEKKREEKVVAPKEKAKRAKAKKVVKKNSPLKERMERISIRTYVVSHLVIIACVVVYFFVVAKNTVVASASMEPTLMTGDFVVYNCLAYEVSDVERGDIVAFHSQEFNEVFSKRVVGVAGDEISFHDGYLFINGMKAEESYIPQGVETNCSKVFKVPENTVFVLGDNRENSIDSRFFANPYISLDDIYGKYAGSISKFW